MSQILFGVFLIIGAIIGTFFVVDYDGVTLFYLCSIGLCSIGWGIYNIKHQ